MAKLSIIRAGALFVEVHLGLDELKIGRGDGVDVDLQSEAVSRLHARVSLTPGGYVIRDEGATNGLFRGGEAVAQHRFEDGDEVEIADFLLHYHADGYQPAFPDMDIAEAAANFAGGASLDGLGGGTTTALQPLQQEDMRVLAHQLSVPYLLVGERQIPVGEQPLLIGFCDSCDIRLPGGKLFGKEAASIHVEADHLLLHKLSSVTSVKVNGEAIRDRRLKDGDILEIGGQRLTAQVPSWTEPS